MGWVVTTALNFYGDRRMSPKLKPPTRRNREVRNAHAAE
jgi:hypothetical protein